MGEAAAFLDDVAAFGLSGILAASAVGQAMNQARFRKVMAGYRILAPSRVPLAARGIPAAGAITGALLLATSTRSAGFLLCGMLFAVFASVVAAALVRGLHGIDCGCNLFAGPSEVTSRLIARNALIATACLVLAPLDRLPGAGWASSAAAAAVALCALAAVQAFGRLEANRVRSWSA